MSRVEIATSPWGVVQDRAGNVRSGLSFTVTTLAAAPATRYAAATGPTTDTSTVTNANGEIPGFIDEGSYIVSVGGVTKQVEAVAGGDVANAARLDQANTFVPPAAGHSLNLSMGSYMGAPSGGNYEGGAINISHSTPATGGSAAIYRPIYVNETYLGTDAATPQTNTYHGIESNVNFGEVGSPAHGTVHGSSTQVSIASSDHINNEHAVYFGFLRNYSPATPGRTWFADWGLHGSPGVQPGLLNGPNMHINNHYNGSPSGGPSAGFWISTMQNAGAGLAAPWDTANTYPVDVGLGIVGTATHGTGEGFTKAIQIGGAGTGWSVPSSKIGTGVHITDFVDYGINVAARFAGATGPSIRTAAGTGPVVINGDPIPAAVAVFQVTSATDLDSLVRFKGSTASTALSVALGNTTGEGKWFVAGSAGSFMVDTVAGDTGIMVSTGKTFHVGQTSSTPMLKVNAAGLGFYGAGPMTRPTITGSRAGNAALASLLTALNARGLVLDSSTA